MRVGSFIAVAECVSKITRHFPILVVYLTPELVARWRKLRMGSGLQRNVPKCPKMSLNFRMGHKATTLDRLTTDERELLRGFA
jgi:hypothetical protein